MAVDIKSRARPAAIAAVKTPVAKSAAVKTATAMPNPVKPVAAVPAKPVAPAKPAAPTKVASKVVSKAPAPRVAPQAILAAPVAPVQSTKPIVKPKETPVNETMSTLQNGAAEAIKSGATTAYSNGKAALEQVTAKSKETVEHGMKSLGELSAMTKGNVEALLASTKAATSGLESIAHQVAEFSRKSFEDTTAVARAMTTVKTPNEFMQLQSDFAKAQFDAAVAEMSKMSETLVKLAGEVFEPMQNRIALATDKLKSAASGGFKI